MFFKTFWRKNKKSNDNKSVIISHLDHFKFKTHIEMRFADFDLMGHVNNAVYFTYLEIGRTKYWEKAIQWDWKKTGIVIGQASIDYIQPIFINDQICMYIRTSRIGSSSFDLEYHLVKTVNGEEITCSKGKTVCVAFDYQNKRPIPIPEHERNKMLQFEQLT